MKIVIASRKGGVGKSSITAAMASLLAAEGRKVLAIDIDPQSNLAFMLGGDATASGTAEILVGQEVRPLKVAENLDVLPGGPALDSREIARLHPEDLADILARLPYDDVLIDCPPGDEHLERQGIVASNIAVVVTNAHPIAVVGAKRVLDDLERLHAMQRRGPSRWALVTNMIDPRRRLDRDIDDMLGEVAAPRFSVRQDTQLALASALGIPLAEFAPRTKAAANIREIMRWCLGQTSD